MGDNAVSIPLLDLGSHADDPLIGELVRLNATSVRLANAISATVARELPAQTVSEYLDMGGRAPDAFLRRVSNFGRKSASELHELVLAADSQRRARSLGCRDLDANDLRRRVCGQLGQMTLSRILAEAVVPVRLLRAMYRAGLAHQRLADVVENYMDACLALAKLPNVGRTTLEAGRRVLCDITSAQLREKGFGPQTVLNSENLLFRRAPLDESALSDIANALAQPARDHLESPGAAVPARGAADVENSNRAEPTVMELIEYALGRLDDRSATVIRRRFGLLGEAQTLEELGRALSVSRERIRQIEAKALRRMRAWCKQQMVKTIVRDGQDCWRALTGGNGYLRARDAQRGKPLLPRHFLLALELCEMGMEAWLNAYARPFDRGWISPDWSVDHLTALRTQLERDFKSRPKPCQLAEFDSVPPSAMVRAAATFAGYSVLGAYITEGRLTPRLQRALRLHAILATSGECAHVVPLLREYRKRNPSDKCSTRDCEIVMQGLQHLFLEVSEGRWAALGPAGEIPSDAARFTGDSTPPHRTQRDSHAATAREGTICRSIEAELRVRGPSRISELIDRANTYLPDGRSRNSVGPILLTRKDLFARPLPGFFALHHQIPRPAELLVAPPPYLLQADQARLYALARSSGEPWGTYPLWSQETEYLWCVWARMHADTALFESLLAIAHIDGWPTNEDRKAWRRLAESRGRFQLCFQHNPETLVLPDPRRLLAGCLYVRQHGYLSWVSANRILMRRVDEQLGGGLLATLVALGVLEAEAEHWQARHSPGPKLREVLSLLQDAFRHGIDFSWQSELGEQLRDAAAKPQPSDCWVTTDVIQTLFHSSPEGDSDRPSELSPLDQLLAEKARVRKSAARQATLGSLRQRDAIP